ncbi:unnamed protein product [Effrenium voratum]|nr:unnamed protein product [Effrenium voratum]
MPGTEHVLRCNACIAASWALLNRRPSRREAAGSFCDSKSIVDALEASGPCAGARKTSVLREGQPQSQEQAKLASLATAVSAATDLATYWSNSVRAYALSRSPFLRPPVFSALWRLHIDFLPGTSGSVSALLRAAHARRVLEIQLSGETVRGVAWCVATTPTPEQGFPKAGWGFVWLWLAACVA